MITADQSAQVRDLVEMSQSIMVIVGADASVDQLAAASALVRALELKGKTVSLCAPEEVGPELTERLPDLPAIQTELGNRDLSVSFAYRPEAVDKVSYHIDDQNQRFHLVIKPQKGQKPLEAETVEFSYVGADADLIFLVGVHELESLEQLYFGYEQFFADTTMITFHTFETNIGAVKLNTSGSSSLSEAMALFLQEIEAPFDASTATHLLVAIEDSTDSFRSLATTADTFEVVAQLLRFGARRIRRQKLNPSPSTGVISRTNAIRPNSSTPSLAQAMNAPKKNGKNAKKAGGLDYQPSATAITGG